MKKLIAEFKEFIMRGNVVDMAVGVIIATSFGKITTSLINDVIMPLISWLTGSRDMTALNILVRPEVLDEAGNVVQAAITIGIGTFIATVVDFMLIALVVFFIVKTSNKAKAVAEELKKKEEEEAAPEEPAGPTTEELLADILAELKNK
ncbi:MAG: large conductance mechanosensitive channel protein MscL [Oscillospiraceae bacterium]|nr:large conductance mechanosensitive channel protein MscL [Oscillospiraceae bacterium]